MVIAFEGGFVRNADVGKLAKMAQLVNVSGPILMNGKVRSSKQYTTRCSYLITCIEMPDDLLVVK